LREAKRPMMCIMTTCGPGRVRGPPWPDAGAAGAWLDGLRHQGDKEERHDKDRGRPPASEHGEISAQPTAATSAKVPRTLNTAVCLRCCCAAPAHPLTQTY